MNGYGWFLAGAGAFWALQQLIHFLAGHGAQGNGELGDRARSKFIAELDHDRLLEFEAKIAKELERRRA